MSFFPMAAAVLASVGQVYQGNAQAAAYEGQAQTAELNARLTRQQGSAAEAAQRRQNAQRMGEVRALAAEGGFDPNSGSLNDLQTKTAAELELDVLTNRYRTQLEAIGLENDAANLRANAKTSRRSGYLNAAGTLMSTAARYGGGPRLDGGAPVETRYVAPYTPPR